MTIKRVTIAISGISIILLFLYLRHISGKYEFVFEGKATYEINRQDNDMKIMGNSGKNEYIFERTSTNDINRQGSDMKITENSGENEHVFARTATYDLHRQGSDMEITGNYHQSNGRESHFNASLDSQVILTKSTENNDHQSHERAPFKPPPKESLTSAKTSLIHIVNHGDILVGDTIEVLLKAFRVNGVPRKSGGDFWFAVLHSKKNGYRSPGAIIDNKNGTFTILFHAGMEGYFNIGITLVHPAEVIEWLQDVYVPNEDCFTWDGHFISKRSELKLEQCQVHHIGETYSFDNEQHCYYGYGPKGLGNTALVCARSNQTACDTLEFLSASGQIRAINDPVDRLLKGKEYLFQGPNYMAEMAKHELIVHKGNIDLQSTREITSSSSFMSAAPTPQGYWLDTTWTSFTSNMTDWAADRINQCLSGTQLILIGDSTMQQWLKDLDRRIKTWEIPINQQYLAKRISSAFNLTFHRNRLCLFFDNKSPFKGPMEFFEPELIDKLPRFPNCKYMIVIGLAAHYGSWTFTNYRERLVTLKKALMKLDKECQGNVTVVIKMAHARDHMDFQARVHSNNWVFFMMNKIMVEIFSDIGATFIDIWDMNLSYPSTLVMHMPMKCIENEVNLFLSQVCPA